MRPMRPPCRGVPASRSTPIPHRRQPLPRDRFGLLPVRSPLLGESSLFLPVLRCFSSRTYLPPVPRWVTPFPERGCPIRTPLDHGLPAAPQGVSPRGHVLPRPPAPRHPPRALSNLSLLDIHRGTRGRSALSRSHAHTRSGRPVRILGYQCQKTKGKAHPEPEGLATRRRRSKRDREPGPAALPHPSTPDGSDPGRAGGPATRRPAVVVGASAPRVSALLAAVADDRLPPSGLPRRLHRSARPAAPQAPAPPSPASCGAAAP